MRLATEVCVSHTQSVREVGMYSVMVEGHWIHSECLKVLQYGREYVCTIKI